MWRLLKIAAILVALWAVWSFVPIHGRTVAARWRAAPDAGAFAANAWREVGAAFGRHEAPARRGPDHRMHGRATRDPRPAEGHTDADRHAVDRIVERHLDETR